MELGHVLSNLGLHKITLPSLSVQNEIVQQRNYLMQYP